MWVVVYDWLSDLHVSKAESFAAAVRADPSPNIVFEYSSCPRLSQPMAGLADRVEAVLRSRYARAVAERGTALPWKNSRGLQVVSRS